MWPCILVFWFGTVVDAYSTESGCPAFLYSLQLALSVHGSPSGCDGPRGSINVNVCTTEMGLA